MNSVFSAATFGSCRKLMNAWASSTFAASFGMTRSSQEMEVPSSRHGEGDVLVLRLHLEDVAAVAVDQQELARGEAGLVLLVLELGQVLLPADDHVAGRRQLASRCGC